MATKKEREIIFNKYGGKCAYCGCNLEKGWHVDEIEPVRRLRTWEHGHWDSDLPRPKRDEDTNQPGFAKWIDARYVSAGALHPERFHIDNQNPSCASCNINKHSGSLEDFRNLITGFMKHLNEHSTQYKIAKRYGLVQETIKPIVFYFETLKIKEK